MEAKFICKTLDSGAKLIRFDNLHDIYYFDEYENNPRGLGFVSHADVEYSDRSHNVRYSKDSPQIQAYRRDRLILTTEKNKIIRDAQKNLATDKEFLELVYKAKSQKREFKLNKFGGNLSMSHYASNNDKIFKKNQIGAKKATLNLAFQVGTFSGGNYNESFERIIKTIMMCQAMNIAVSIDMFDSDTGAVRGSNAYVICNVAKSHEKLNLKNILACSHREFFDHTLFNGYSASGCQRSIDGYVGQNQLIKDLGEFYDVIGGNMLLDKFEGEQLEMVSKIIKIGINGNNR